MAMQTQNAAPSKEETPESPTPDSPLLDLNKAAVKRMIKESKKRGWVTVDELNAVLPSEEVTSEQIEDTMSMLSEMGINVVESEDAEEANTPNANGEEKGPENDELVEVPLSIPGGANWVELTFEVEGAADDAGERPAAGPTSCPSTSPSARPLRRTHR